MAVSKVINATTLSIEVQKGVDKSGDPLYTKKSFANVRNDVSEQNAYDVAEAIKAVLEASTRNASLTVSSNLVKA
ncbi:hypothetical protein psyc5s11_49770 [Clostridium gelidum]|uniref:DUF1659 domain-containing protein n=1 Tax=Clostridium gelidum TaxID=704125 RepID=A0ABN6J3R4_9CLOT|nr:DUF1659 domain-containing protein [Clostridium gelidum]BCZ48910.1 hypothetical protein psyc5s11_49770 [Clostridium gelidum]